MISTRIRACLLAAALLAGACGGGDDRSSVTVPAETTSSPTTSTSTTTTTADPTAAVEQAFYDQWDAFVEIAGNPDPSNPLIDRHFIGNAKEGVLDGVSRLLARGFAIRLPDDASKFAPSIREIEITSPTTAVVFECTLDGLVVFDRTSGAIDNDAVDQLAQRNEFELVDGDWKAADVRATAAGEPRCEEF